MQLLCRRPGFILLLSLGLAWLAPHSAAQVVYLRNIPLPSGHTALVPLTGTPRYSGDAPPGYELTGHYLLAGAPGNGTVYQLDYSTWTYGVRYDELSGTRLIDGSIAAWADDNSPRILITGTSFALSSHNLVDGQLTRQPMNITYANGNNSLLSRGGELFVLAANGTENSVTGPKLWRLDSPAQSTLLLSTGGSAPGQLGAIGSAAFGPDGLLYVLDQADGINRIQRFDVSEGLAEDARFQGSFAVSFSFSSLAVGMAISPEGHLYLGDGAGGLLTYDLEGNFLGATRFTGEASPDANGADGATGRNFVSLDPLGNLFVYTPETGIHQYADLAAVPEPAISAVLAGLAALGVVRRRAARKTTA